jgi:hypothetical protein
MGRGRADLSAALSCLSDWTSSSVLMDAWRSFSRNVSRPLVSSFSGAGAASPWKSGCTFFANQFSTRMAGASSAVYALFEESGGMQQTKRLAVGLALLASNFAMPRGPKRAARQRRIRARLLAGDAQTMIERAAPDGWTMPWLCSHCRRRFCWARSDRSQNSHGLQMQGKSRRICGLRVRKMHGQETTHRDCHNFPRFQVTGINSLVCKSQQKPGMG